MIAGLVLALVMFGWWTYAGPVALWLGTVSLLLFGLGLKDIRAGRAKAGKLAWGWAATVLAGFFLLMPAVRSIQEASNRIKIV